MTDEEKKAWEEWLEWINNPLQDEFYGELRPMFHSADAELTALRGEVARLRKAVEWALTYEAYEAHEHAGGYEFDRDGFMAELKRRAGEGE